MHDCRCQPRQARQAGGMIEIGDEGNGACGAQFGATFRLAGSDKHPKAGAHQRQQTHADIAAAKDQQAWLTDFF